MKKPVEIEVTQADIDNGRPGSATSCPVALAVKRTFNVDRGVSVNRDRIWFDLKAYEAPGEVKWFVDEFDGRCRFAQPFTFKLSVPRRLRNKMPKAKS